jgi:hypothetical protein
VFWKVSRPMHYNPQAFDWIRSDTACLGMKSFMSLIKNIIFPIKQEQGASKAP